MRNFAYIFVFSVSFLTSAFAGEEIMMDQTQWSYEAMRGYVKSTPFFESKPCIVFRELWDPAWSVQIKNFDLRIAQKNKLIEKAKNHRHVKIPNLRVELQTREDIKTLTLHHAEFFEGSSAADIKRMHVSENRWADVGYHYIVAKKTPPETYFTRVMLRRMFLSLRQRGYSNQKIQEIFDFHFEDFQQRREQFESFKRSALLDPRNKGCVLASEDWLLFEGRAERFQGAHAGAVTLKFLKNTDLFQVVAVNGGHSSGLEFMPDGSAPPRLNLWGIRDVLKEAGFIQGGYYKVSADFQNLVLVDATGKALLHPVTNQPKLISIKAREKAFKVTSAGKGSFRDGELVKLNYNHGSIGVVISGAYHEYDETTPFGYFKNSPEWVKQPDQGAVRILGQLTNMLKSQYPLQGMLAHRSGTLPEKHNCSGGHCPGEGALELLRSLNARFFAP